MEYASSPEMQNQQPQSPPAAGGSSCSSISSSPLSVPFFEETEDAPICSKVPNASTIYLWNHFFMAVAKTKEFQKVSSFWSASNFQRRGILTKPKHQQWGKVLKTVYNRLLDDTAPPVRMVILTGDASLVNYEKTNDDNAWPWVLQELINKIFDQTILQIGVVAIDSSTTPLQTHGLLPNEQIDILVDAHATQDMMMLLGNFHGGDPSETPELSNQLSHLKQAWIRSVLLKCEDPPLLWILDNYIGDNRGILTDSIYTRVVRRLADWYQIPFTSFGNLVRPLLYQGHLQQFPTDRQNTYGIASLLAFGALQFTIDYCSSRSDIPAKESPLLQSGVQELVNDVVPPALDLGLTLQEVSSKWKAAGEEQRMRCSK